MSVSPGSFTMQVDLIYDATESSISSPSFGIPVTVEWGEHIVTLTGDTGKLLVYLQIDSPEADGFRVFQFDAPGDMEIRVNVGSYETIESIVTASPVSQ